VLGDMSPPSGAIATLGFGEVFFFAYLAVAKRPSVGTDAAPNRGSQQKRISRHMPI